MTQTIWSGAFGRLMTFAFAVTFLAGGCGGNSDGQTFEAIAKAQSSESAAWAKAKAEGKDKRKPARVSNRGNRGYVNGPGA